MMDYAYFEIYLENKVWLTNFNVQIYIFGLLISKVNKIEFIYVKLKYENFMSFDINHMKNRFLFVTNLII